MKFGIGQPMRRHEDLRLITGRGRYTDDIILPRMTHAFVLRSPVAHAHIKRIDVAAARRMPGVLFVATGEDVRADGLGDVPCMVPLVNRDGTPRHDTPRPVLALGKVRHVGQPVALVVAETLTAARDAAEAIDVEYEPLPAITEAKDSISPGAPQLFDHHNNRCLLYGRRPARFAATAAATPSAVTTVTPRADAFAALINLKNPSAAISTKEAQNAAHALGKNIHIVHASAESELEPAFATIAQLQAGGLLIAPDGLFIAYAAQVAALSLRHAIPASHERRAFPDAGGLMSYGASQADGIRLAGGYTGRILKGEKPADLPVMQPTKFELVINIKTPCLTSSSCSPTR